MTADLAVTLRVSAPSTIRVRTPVRYVFSGKFAADTLSGASTVTYEAVSTPAPNQSPGTAARDTLNATRRFLPGPAGIVNGTGRIRVADSGLPDGVAAISSLSVSLFNWPSPSASRQRAILETSPGRGVIPVTSTRTLRRLIAFVVVETFNRRKGTSFCPGSTVGGAREVPRTVRVSPGGGIPGGRNRTAREFCRGSE